MSFDQKRDEEDKPFEFVEAVSLHEVQSVAEEEGCNFVLVMENEHWRLRASTLEEKQAWMIDIRTAIQQLKKKKRATASLSGSRVWRQLPTQQTQVALNSSYLWLAYAMRSLCIQ